MNSIEKSKKKNEQSAFTATFKRLSRNALFGCERITIDPETYTHQILLVVLFALGYTLTSARTMVLQKKKVYVLYRGY